MQINITIIMIITVIIIIIVIINVIKQYSEITVDIYPMNVKS